MKFTFTAAQRVQITGVGDFFRLLSTVGPVTVEFYNNGREIAERVDVEAGFAEQFRTIEFDRVDITSASAQLVQWETALGSEIRYDRGAATVSGTVGLDAATLLALEQINVRPEAQTGFYNTNAALAANTAEQIFSPASNVSGAILLSGSIISGDTSTANTIQTLLSKSSAPTTVFDGSSLLVTAPTMVNVQYVISAELKKAEFISAGQGLYFISSSAVNLNQNNARSCRFKLL